MTNRTIWLAIVFAVAVSGTADDLVQDNAVAPVTIHTVAGDNAIVEALLRFPGASVDRFPQHRSAVRRYLSRVR